MLRFMLKRAGCFKILLFCVFFLTSAATTKADSAVKLIQISKGLLKPLYVTNAGDGSNRLFVVEKGAKVKVIKDNVIQEIPFLDIESRVELKGDETGLLSMAFHPDYNNNGRFFVNYTKVDLPENISSGVGVTSEVIEGLKTVVAEYRVSEDNPDVADDGEKIILTVDQPTNIHNGGQLQFGPDGYLYIGAGDGGPADDGSGNGQNKDTLLGAILRIDVDDGEPFSIPSDNPFVNEDGADEIYAYGFRNPWRFSFDSLDGRLFAGDVGQRSFEEIDIVETSGNYGWSLFEGNHCFIENEDECDQLDHIPPIVEYSHSEGQAVVCGYVYRGTELPDLEGLYLFGDFGSGKIWTLKENFRNNWKRELLLETNFLISSFGEDEQGELYVVGFAGSVFKIVDPLTPELIPQLTPEPTPEVVLTQSVNIECDQRLRTGFNGRKKLFMNAGSRVSCLLSVDNPGFEMPITLSFGIRSEPDNNILIGSDDFVLDENGEFEFTINAIKGGDNWLEWSLADEIGGLMFNIKPRDRVRLATMFVGVEY